MIQVAGAGPRNPELLTLEVYRAIQEAKAVVAFGRIGESLKGIRADINEVTRVAHLMEYVEKYDDLLILASGDPMFFGITNFLYKQGVKVDRIMPGLSSFQYLTASLGLPWQEAHFFSLHGRSFEISELGNYPLSIGLVDKNNTPTELSRALKSQGLRGKITVGNYLSYDNEKIETIEIGEDSTINDGLSVVVVELEMD